ncbi:MAG: hypothetical protein APF76_10410 [Desulfitibacter sp. BRH_c19]|nr:MAG: hypothetical protein APF76_10410 [Desulfitibacter sp. BRH_c19]
MVKKITISLDRILWKWWVGKDSNHQEAFDDLIDTILINLEDLDTTPWKSSMMQELTFEVPDDKLQIINNSKNALSLEEYLNGCLKFFRAEEEKIRSLFS